MTTARARTQGVDPGKSARTVGLSIGDLAARTGLTPAVLRMWETRYGFPQPQRLESGHRRYADSDVAVVEAILRRREAGVRLEVAVAEAAGRAEAESTPASPSVYAELRRRHPHLAHQRLHKSTLLALSWAIEDECLARAERALVFGAFQEPRFFEAARHRWTEIARVAGATVALAAFDAPSAPGEVPVRVPLDDRAPLRREWAVVCDGPRFAAALTAWEVPGQAGVPDGRRVFESLWTVEPGPVRDAARVCADVARAAVPPEVRSMLEGEPARAADPIAAEALLHRVLAYADRAG
jgi:DICT domain-containing protein